MLGIAPPKAQRPVNAQAWSQRLLNTAAARQLWRARGATPPPKGHAAIAAAISQVGIHQGIPEDRGVMPVYRPRPFFMSETR